MPTLRAGGYALRLKSFMAAICTPNRENYGVVAGRLIASVMFAASLGIPTLSATPALADITGPAIVTDGDTIKIDVQRIRIHGIDAPEQKQSPNRGPGSVCRLFLITKLCLK